MVPSICVAAALGWTVSVAAQTSAATQHSMDKNKDMTITGCLEKNKSGGFWLTHAMSKAASDPKGTTGSTTTSSTTTTPSETTTSSDASMKTGMNWNLEGGKDLDQHVGHKIEVMGRAKDDTSGDQVKGTTGDKEMQARDFDVKSVRMIASSCS